VRRLRTSDCGVRHTRLLSHASLLSMRSPHPIAYCRGASRISASLRVGNGHRRFFFRAVVRCYSRRHGGGTQDNTGSAREQASGIRRTRLRKPGPSFRCRAPLCRVAIRTMPQNRRSSREDWETALHKSRHAMPNWQPCRLRSCRATRLTSPAYHRSRCRPGNAPGVTMRARARQRSCWLSLPDIIGGAPSTMRSRFLLTIHWRGGTSHLRVRKAEFLFWGGSIGCRAIRGGAGPDSDHGDPWSDEDKNRLRVKKKKKKKE